MKKTGKFIAAMTMALAVLISANPVMASADEEHSRIDGYVMSMYSSISENSASAQSYAGLGQVYTSVSASYTCVNVREGSIEDNTVIEKNASNSGYYASYVSFSAPYGYESVRITAAHSFNWNGVGSTSGYTSGNY